MPNCEEKMPTLSLMALVMTAQGLQMKKKNGYTDWKKHLKVKEPFINTF